jgi:hypothetical protein
MQEKIEKIIKKMEKQRDLTKKLHDMIEDAKLIKLNGIWYKLLKIDKGDAE